MQLPVATAKYRELIDAIARSAGLADRGFVPYTGLEMVEAVALHESAGDPRARHYDPHIDQNHMDDGDYEPCASYGLFQVEGLTALALLGLPLTTRMNFTWLFRPAANVAFGVRTLAESLEAFGGPGLVWARALAAYNGGVWGARMSPTGRLNDEAYVDRVLAAAGKVQACRMAAGGKA